MKKLFLLLALVLCSGTVFAETTFTDADEPDGKTTTGVVNSFRTSKNVILIAEGVSSTYSAVSGHTQGDRAYGSAAGDSKIYWASKDAGTDVSYDLSASDTSAFVNADGTIVDRWNSL